MGERVRRHVAPALLLQPVVADGAGGVQRLFQVAGFQNLAALSGVGPDARETVGLQLLAHGQQVGLRLACAAFELLDPAGDTDECLHVMADFVGDHVGLGEVAAGAEAGAQILEEAQVDINLPVGGTVERPHRRLGQAAGGLDGPAEQDQGRLLVAATHLGHESVPGILRLGQHHGGELAALIHGAGRAVGGGRRGLLGVQQLQKRPGIDIQEIAHDQNGDQPDAAVHAGAAQAGAPSIVDIGALSSTSPAHRRKPDGVVLVTG